MNVREDRLKETKLNNDNLSAIQGYPHNNNYVVIDKKNRLITVYDKDNNPLYTTKDFAVGASGNDYNTITYVNDNGTIISGKGNNSTPAGILEITGKSTYHGYPAYIRSRTNRDGSKENIASSLHWGNIGKNIHASNGCIRIGGKTLCELEPYLPIGTKVYTLPEKEGSRFTLKGGVLHYTADNPYGETEGSKRYWDDYNTVIDKSYFPISVKYTNTENEEYNQNRKQFSQSIVNNKKNIQNKFGLTSYEYNQLAELALGIAEQESKYGTSLRYDIKNTMPDWVIQLGKRITRGNTDAKSRGITQIKMEDDNKEMQKIYKNLGITTENIENIDKAALATIARLAYMYNNEVRGRNFKDAYGNKLDPYHALLYKYSGKHKELTNKTATPLKNIYIRNVNKYSRNFDMYETRSYDKYKLGGRLTLEEI